MVDHGYRADSPPIAATNARVSLHPVPLVLDVVARLARAFLLQRCAMRAVPQMRVEVAGVIVTRPAVLDVMQHDRAGTIARLLPQLHPGEALVERPGRIRAIVKEQPCPST
jgi:hypothetical protein